MDLLDVLLRISGPLGLAGVLVAVIGKKVTPRRSPAEIHDSRVVELERARTTDHQELTNLKQEFGDFRESYRKVVDYAHDLRSDYANETGKSPRDWPQGVRL